MPERLNVPFSGSGAPIQLDRSHSHGSQEAREEVDQGQDRREKDGEEEVTPRPRFAVREIRTPVTTAIRLSFPLGLFALNRANYPRFGRSAIIRAKRKCKSIS
jgi:hypothetical protein